jgi:hypothetical protein
MKFLLVLLIAVFQGQVLAQTGKSRGNTFNPDIGLNGLFSYRNGTRGNEATSLATNGYRNGFMFDEAELQFSADVDPYLRAVGNFALAHNGTAWEFEPEEVYAETIGFSLVSIRFGKISAYINKHSLLHTHAFPFVDAPLINSELLGDEGLKDTGIQISALLPTSWYMELTLQALTGEDPAGLFGSPSTNDHVGVAYLDLLFDLSDSLTLQIGPSITHGQNVNDSQTNIGGADLGIKWKPEGNENVRTLKWMTHGLWGDQGAPTGNLRKNGVSSYVQWQWTQRWWAQVRAETVNIENGSTSTGSKKKNSVLVAFTPSEFSAVRTQLDELTDGVEPVERRVTVQFNWSIGAHPAHQY